MSKAKQSNPVQEQTDGERRATRCTAELDAVLKRHRCVLEAVILIGPQGIQRTVQVVPLA